MVYVDDMRTPYRGMIMCHMIADTTEELLAMVKAIGINVKHIQCEGTTKEHFDLSLTYRAKAVKEGAKEITWRESGEMIIARRKKAEGGQRSD